MCWPHKTDNMYSPLDKEWKGAKVAGERSEWVEGVIVRTPVQVFICGPNNAVNMRPAASGKRSSWLLAVGGSRARGNGSGCRVCGSIVGLLVVGGAFST